LANARHLCWALCPTERLIMSMELMKILQEGQTSSSLQGQLFVLQEIRTYIDSKIKDVQDRIDNTESGKILKSIEERKQNGI
tara:strand:- start:270 stop:515 length:246 start_codon:yes stop_codon:yes gene_type:complete